MRPTLLAALLSLGLGVGTLRAADDAPLLVDDFGTLRAGWGIADKTQSVSGNRLLVDLPTNSGHHVLYQDSQFDNADIRLKVSELKGAVDQSAGIIFWAGEKGDCYTALVQADGNFYIARRQHNHWLVPVTLKVRAEVQQGLGKVNSLRVVTSGRRATIFVNDQQVTSIQGFPPAGKSRIGIHAESGTGPVSFAFSDLSVRQGPTPDTQVDDALLLSDDFTTLDPAWRAVLGAQSANRNSMNVSLAPQQNLRDLYWANLFADSDARIVMSQASGATDDPAGLIFWGAGSDNHYSFVVTADGSYYIVRRRNGKWLYIAQSIASDAIRKGLGQTNELRVVTSGRRATIYVNDQQLTTLQGFPPVGGSMIGVQAESGDKAGAWSFSKLRMRQGPPSSDATPQDDSLLLADDFRTLDPSWGRPSDIVRVDQNHLVMSPAKNTTYTNLFRGGLFDNIDVRAKITLVQGGNDVSAGIDFWATSFDNRYVARLYADGTFQVARMVQGKSVLPVSDRIVDATKKGINQTNELRVVTSGRQATFYVNGQQVTSIRGFPPEGDSQIGLTASSDEAPHIWQFSDLSMRQGPASQEAPPKDKTILLADDFATLDPAWGDANESMHVAANKLIFSPKLKIAYTILYGGGLFTNVDFRAKVEQSQGGDNSSAAIVFWGTDYSNYYSADLFTDGNVGVSHRLNGKWSYPIAGRVRAAVKLGQGQPNELRVVTSGNTATVYVNDQKIGTVLGSPPEGGASVGLQASSDDKLLNIWAYSDVSIRQGPEPGPDSPVAPKPLPDTIVKAWSDADVDTGWMRQNEYGLPVFVTGKGTGEAGGMPGDLPGFSIRGTSDVNYGALPAPPAAFGVFLLNPFGGDLSLPKLAAFQNLQSLSVMCPRGNDASLTGLAGMKNLRFLRITCPGATDASANLLAGMAALEMLSLNFDRMTDVGIRQLAGLTNLQVLNISGSQITDAGVKDLIALKNLRVLNISNTPVTDAGVRELAALENLQILSVGENIAADTIKQLQQALPACGISK